MASVSVEQQIDAAPEDVFRAFSDFENAAQFITGIVRIEMLTTGAVRVGTRWRETRIMFKKEATEEIWLTEFEPPRQYVAEAESNGAHYRSAFRFVPNDGGTRVTMDFEATPVSLFARLTSFLMAPMMLKSVVKVMEQDMIDLKTAIEKKPGAAGTADSANTLF